MSDKLTFAHLTDLHIGDPDTADPGLMTDTNTTVAAVLDKIGRMQPAPAFVVVSGDIVNRGDEASYRAAKAIFESAALPMPVVFALGNHDARGPFYRVMLGRDGNDTRPYDHDVVVAGLHVIVLDTSRPGRIAGDLDPAQLDWLAGCLAAEPGRRKLIVMHHGPMLDEGEPDAAWQSIGAEATARLREIVEGRMDIAGILSGHIHYDRVTSWYGIPLVVGIGQHNATDVLFLNRGMRALAGASFAVGTLRPSGLTVSFVPHLPEAPELAVTESVAFAALIARFDGAAE